jgi:hypothetical protein
MIRDCLKNIKLAKNMSCCVNDKEDPSLLYCVCNDQDGCSGDANVACKKNDITHFKKHVSKRSIMIKKLVLIRYTITFIIQPRLF